MTQYLGDDDNKIQIYQKKYIHKKIKFSQFGLNFVKYLLQYINPLTTNVPHDIETSHLIYKANQLTGFYMMGNIDR